MRMLRIASFLVLVVACLIWNTQEASAYQIYYSWCNGTEGWVEAYAFYGCSSGDAYWACVDACSPCGEACGWQCYSEGPENFAASCVCAGGGGC